MNLKRNRRWVALNFCQFLGPSFHHVRFEYDYEFVTCILKKLTLRGKKVLSRSLKCYPSLSPSPQGAAARFRVGRRNAQHFRLARSGLENLRNFRAPLVFKAIFLWFW